MRSSIIHASTAGALCVGAIVAYGVWYAAVEDINVTVADLQSQIDAKTKTAEHVSIARAVLSEIAGDEAIVQGYFIPETDVVAFIDDLETRGRLQKTAVSVLSVAKDTINAHQALAFSISISGTFDAVMRTVGAIEYAPYDLSLSSLSLVHDDTNVWHATSKLLVGSVSAAATASTTSLINSPQTKP
ncbi:MAG: hypothetical protein Q8P17_02455 [bacterium]|nr:hypothetical protein [bacterium]